MRECPAGIHTHERARCQTRGCQTWARIGSNTCRRCDEQTEAGRRSQAATAKAERRALREAQRALK